jgi:hypothetical protein
MVAILEMKARRGHHEENGRNGVNSFFGRAVEEK